MIELRADVELKDNIFMAMSKIKGKGHYVCNVCVEYEWKPPRCASCKVFGHIHEECPKNTGAGEKKTLRKPSQTSRGVSVGSKMGFKPHKEYRHVPQKPTASSSGTNRRTTNLVNNWATSSGSSFMNVNNSSTSTTPIIDKIKKFKELLTSGQAIFMDEAGNPLKNVEYPGDYDSEDERVSYGNGDYDEDLYNDDIYEGQDLPQEIQAICDNLDIRVRGDPDCDVPVTESFHEQTDDELTEKEAKHMEADDQAIQTIFIGLLEDIYALVDSCNTALEIWLRVQQMMKCFDIGLQEKENGFIVVLRIANQNRNGNVLVARAEGDGNGNNGNYIWCYNCRGLDHYARNYTVIPRRRDAAYLQTQLLIAQKEEAGIQL
nr:hypothetical protein [Tanacetum cinerariifolium]